MRSWLSTWLLLVTLLLGVSLAQQEADPAECDAMVAGDIYFTYLRSQQPDELVLFIFEDIPGNMKLYLTDNAWTGTDFQADEGTLEVSRKRWSKSLGLGATI